MPGTVKGYIKTYRLLHVEATIVTPIFQLLAERGVFLDQHRCFVPLLRMDNHNNGKTAGQPDKPDRLLQCSLSHSLSEQEC